MEKTKEEKMAMEFYCKKYDVNIPLLDPAWDIRNVFDFAEEYASQRQGYPEEFYQWAFENTYWNKIKKLYLCQIHQLHATGFDTISRLFAYWQKEIEPKNVKQ